jgi:hypothetical protein
MRITRDSWGNIYWVNPFTMLFIPKKHDIMSGEPWVGFTNEGGFATTNRRDAARILSKKRIQERRGA